MLNGEPVIGVRVPVLGFMVNPETWLGVVLT
jgi:hypothetical protein